MATAEALTRQQSGLRAEQGRPAPHGFRPDIQGLRAVAVLLVVADHLLGVPVGGFVGVDIFFVISGFLITGLLMKELRDTGRVSFTGFYTRRARRIVPAALVVLVLTTVASNVLFVGARAREVTVDATWSFAFAANWRFADAGTDYFDARTPPSPLQHYWSLAVEEQFYLVWPVVLVAVAWVAARRLRSPVAALAVVAGALVAASFAWAVALSASDPHAAYFSSVARGWELGAGALLALSGHAFSRLRPAARNAMGVAGLAGIAVAAVTTDPARGFPGPWAALPVLSAVLVLAAGTGGVPAATRVLGVRPALYVGTVSYSLYLWHWPVITLLDGLVPGRTPTFYVIAVVASLGAAAASYRWVERPVQRSGWLRPRAARHPAADGTTTRRHLARASLPLLALTACVLVALAVAVQVPRVPSPTVATGARATAVPDVERETAEPLPVPDPAARTAAIGAALDAVTWPVALAPALEVVGETDAPERRLGCNKVRPDEVATCSFGRLDAPRTAIVVGDSISLSWLAGLRAALEPQGWRLKTLTRDGCPVVDADLGTLRADTACQEHLRWVLAQVEAAAPDLVIASSASHHGTRTGVSSTGTPRLQEWQSAATRTFTRLQAAADRVVVLAPPPPGKDPRRCFTRFTTPADCTSTVPDAWSGFVAADAAAAAAAGAQYVDTRSWFCSVDGRCPIFVDGVTVRRDDRHITAEYATDLAPELLAALAPPA